MQRLHRPDLRGSEAVGRICASALQAGHVKALLAGHRVGHEVVLDAVRFVTGCQHRCVHQLNLGAWQPRIAHGRQAGPGADVLQARPVDDRHAAENAIKVIGVTLRHREPFPAAFRAAHKVQLVRRAAISPLCQRHRDITHLLVRGVREVDKGFIVRRKGLGRNARRILVA